MEGGFDSYAKRVPFCPWDTLEEMLAALTEFVQDQRQMTQRRRSWQQRAVDTGPQFLSPPAVAPRVRRPCVSRTDLREIAGF